MSALSFDLPPVEEGLDLTDRQYRQVCEFLYREAMLLDRAALREWLAHLHEDVTYRLSGPVTAMSDNRSASAAGAVLLMDENRQSLESRVKQLLTPSLTVAENPGSIMRRFVTNIFGWTSGDGFVVQSCCLFYRQRVMEDQPHFFSTLRQDRIMPTAQGLRLLSREAVLDQTVIQARNLSMLF